MYGTDRTAKVTTSISKTHSSGFKVPLFMSLPKLSVRHFNSNVTPIFLEVPIKIGIWKVKKRAVETQPTSERVGIIGEGWWIIQVQIAGKSHRGDFWPAKDQGQVGGWALLLEKLCFDLPSCIDLSFRSIALILFWKNYYVRASCSFSSLQQSAPEYRIYTYNWWDHVDVRVFRQSSSRWKTYSHSSFVS